MRIASTALAALAAASSLALLNAAPVVARSVPRCHGVRATEIGSKRPDYFQTGRGRDVIVGRGGNDVVSAGSGNDIVCGGRGVDTLLGRGGADKIYGGDAGDVIYGDGGADFQFGGAGSDGLFGGTANDVIFGDDGGDLLEGGRQRDRCTGGKPKRDFSPRHIRDYASDSCEVSNSAYHPA
jgi:Ca2+-binding RTX toxin-like protein